MLKRPIIPQGSQTHLAGHRSDAMQQTRTRWRKRGRKMRRKTMRTMLLAAAAGLSLAASTAAYADGGDGPAANSFFTELPGVVAQADVPNASAYAQNRQVQPQQAQNGQGTHVYATQSSRGTWLFQANPNQGANS
jgi:hypothetical protein